MPDERAPMMRMLEADVSLVDYGWTDGTYLKGVGSLRRRTLRGLLIVLMALDAYEYLPRWVIDSVRAYGSTHSPFRLPFEGMGGMGTLVDVRPGSIDGRPLLYPAVFPLTMATESGRSESPNGKLVGLTPLYRSGRRGGDLGMATACLRSASCWASAFLLVLISVLLERRNS